MAVSKKRARWYKLIIVAFTLLLVFIALKVYVGPAPNASGLTDWQHFNDSLNLANKAFAENHPHKFTDRPRKVEKDSGIYRIAVLGDSFIWGDGLPYDSAWSHKLEQRILVKYDSVEVMHWGRNGWQTKQEFEFYATEGKKYKPDLLIIGYVDNDPDMGRFKHMNLDFRNNYSLLYKIWPSLAEKILADAYSKSYAKWLKRLYGEENMGIYKQLWLDFKDTLAAQGQDYFIVLTPACLYPSCSEYYNKVVPVFDSLQLENINLIPICNEKLAHIEHGKLLANPANYHPGTKMTNVFADEVLKYLETSGRLPVNAQ